MITDRRMEKPTFLRSWPPKTEPMRWLSGWFPRSELTYATRSLWPAASGTACGWTNWGMLRRCAVTRQHSAYFLEIASATSAGNGYAIAWKGCTGGKRLEDKSLRTYRTNTSIMLQWLLTNHCHDSSELSSHSCTTHSVLIIRSCGVGNCKYMLHSLHDQDVT